MAKNTERTDTSAAGASGARKRLADANGETTNHAMDEELDERIVMAVQAASDKKAIDPLVLDLRPIANFTDFFFITSGANARQVQAIADEVVERLKRAGNPAQRVEGYTGAEWVLIDYGDFVVHVFEERARRFYDLERLWREAARVDLKPELFAEDKSPAADER